MPIGLRIAAAVLPTVASEVMDAHKSGEGSAQGAEPTQQAPDSDVSKKTNDQNADRARSETLNTLSSNYP